MSTKQKIYLVSLLTILIIIGVDYMWLNDCPQLYIFDGDIFYLLKKSLIALGIIAGIWWLGYLISKRFNLKTKALIAYFVLLSGLAMHRQIINNWSMHFGSTKKLITSLCHKSTDNGMVCTFENLTLTEYRYLTRNVNWLPKAPANLLRLNIHYYRDNFLGDYSLNVEIELPKNEPLDTMVFGSWEKSWRDVEKGNWYEYSEWVD